MNSLEDLETVIDALRLNVEKLQNRIRSLETSNGSLSQENAALKQALPPGVPCWWNGNETCPHMSDSNFSGLQWINLWLCLGRGPQNQGCGKFDKEKFFGILEKHDIVEDLDTEDIEATLTELNKSITETLEEISE